MIQTILIFKISSKHLNIIQRRREASVLLGFIGKYRLEARTNFTIPNTYLYVLTRIISSLTFTPILFNIPNSYSVG
ncbi:MAG: hypothetical protein CFE24_08425 [Flavobacterium sp. BFFFF2]|nr:MAG: hypothetical protein CFE24_08425 [Flavobacterium sp. BFFFF2]